MSLPQIGPLEIMVVLAIVLLIFGPKKLPELGRSMGKGLREFKSSLNKSTETEDDGPAAEAAKPVNNSRAPKERAKV